MIKGNYVRSWIQVIIILNFENVRLYFTYVVKLHYLSEMLTLNEMLIFCFERHAVGECPTVVLYKYRKNIKIRNNTEVSRSAAELYNRLFSQIEMLWLL